MRNPNWSPANADSVRPAYADKIVWNAGIDPTVAANKTLDSTNLLMADTPPAPVLKTAYESKKKQLSIAPLGIYYAALNTQVPPFNNINLRKAVLASRIAMPIPGSRRQARRDGSHALHLSGGPGLQGGRRDGGVQTGLRLAPERRPLGRVQVHEGSRVTRTASTRATPTC